MSKTTRKFRDRFEAAVVHKAGRLSPRSQRFLAGGGEVVIDGQVLHPESRMLLTLIERSGGLALDEMTVSEARAELNNTTGLLAGPPPPMHEVRNLMISGYEGPIGARLYTPECTTDTIAISFHGGGGVVGDLESHDSMCRFLAVHANTKVLSVDYRLAPEHPFPAAPLDAFAAFEWTVAHADDLGIDPLAIAVMGDSAGGNLAASLCVQARDTGGPQPAFQLLLFPMLDLGRRFASFETFARGYLLTANLVDHWLGMYLGSPENARDPLASPALADLAGLPPAYVATAGFDPIRDDGEHFAELLRQAGVPTVTRRHPGLIHGFAAATGFGNECAGAMREAAGALQTGLALGRTEHVRVETSAAPVAVLDQGRVRPLVP